MAATADVAASVVTWFEFYTRLYEDDACVARPSRTLLRLLQSAFPALYEEAVERRLALGSDEWTCVVLLLEAFYEVELGTDRSSLNDAMTFEEASLHSPCIEILEYTVGALVQSDSKTQFVGDIMGMEDSVQVDIMAVIERVLKHTTSIAASGALSCSENEVPCCEASAHENETRDERLDTPTRSLSGQSSFSSPSGLTSSRSPLHLSRNAEVERLQRANEILKEESIHIAKELDEVKAKLRHAEAENTSLHEKIKNIQLQTEMDILKKERTVRSYFDERMHSLQRELERVNCELEEKAAIAKQANELRDEIDLLRPSAEKLARAEATLTKYKTKIEDLASVNEKLRRTEEANADLVEKNLFLENQAARATALQRKLADSKEANTAIQFQVSELEAKLSRITSELEAKRSECDSTTTALVEAKSIINQLQQTVEQQIDAKGGYAASDEGIAGGISELNPELMEKLARLEYENASLRSQVDGTTSDRIDCLLDNIEDLKRMKKSFEVKYFETNDALKETEERLKNTELSLGVSQEELAQQTRVFHDTVAERDTLARSLEDAEQKILELTDVNKANAIELARLVEVMENLKQELRGRMEDIASLQLTLRQTVQDLQLSNERNDCLCEDVHAHLVARQEMVLQRHELQGTIQGLEAQRAHYVTRIKELEGGCDSLRELFESAHDQISSLRENDARLAMRCEELHGVLVEKSEVIIDQAHTISLLTATTHALEKDVSELKEETSSRDDQIQLQTERLHLLTEDLALIQAKRFDLILKIERLEVQDRQRVEEVRQTQEIACATLEDYEHRLFLHQEQKVVELATLARAHGAQMESAAIAEASRAAEYEAKLDRLSQDKADTISRMTTVIDEKCNLLQQAKETMSKLSVEHERSMQGLRVRMEQELSVVQKEKDTIASELAAYSSCHSFLDEDVASKEAKLREKLSELSKSSAEEKSVLIQQRDSMSDQVRNLRDANRDMKASFENQELKLREAIKSQLEANRKLVEVNQAVKDELMKKAAKVSQLENVVTRLDSRIRMLERDQHHFVPDDGGKRETDDSSASYSSQLNIYLTQITEELDLLRKENKKLQERLTNRVNDRAEDSEEGVQPSTKSYLMEKIRQLELAKSAEEDKKRELLLVNAKLIQDRKQIQVRNASDSKEVQHLKEKVNTWMLRDERRKKEHEAIVRRVRELETENKRLRSRMPTETIDSSSELQTPSSQESHESLMPVKSACSEDRENIPPSETVSSPPVVSRKRKIDSIDADGESPTDDDPVEDNEASSSMPQDVHGDVDKSAPSDMSIPVSASSETTVPRAKRRMSQFMSSRLSLAATTTLVQQEDEKPSECQQQ